MYAEQGYFTRGKKSKFTGEAGFDVVDVSDGINEETANFYIRSVGESIVFDSRTDGEKWLYAILPSRRDGCLSVTRAFPTSDGKRTCHFSHTYLFDEKTAKQILNDDMRLSNAARITGFCGEYIGEPVGLKAAVPELDGELAPEKIKLQDTGFSGKEQIVSLLNLIVLLHENRGAKPNPLKSIFIVYECGPDEFKRKAFSLISLLYSCMPYDIMSKLGVVVRTDAEWRKDESYISGYASAYMLNSRDAKEYIPGGELYILNTPLAAVPADVCVITVKSGGVTIPVKLDIPPAYKYIFGDIADYMQNGAGKPVSEPSRLHDFYKFTADITGGVPSFRDMCNLYQLAEALGDPAEAAKKDLKYTVRILKLLNISMEKNFDKTDNYWQEQANKFVAFLSGELLKFGSGESIPEEACVLMLKVGRRVRFGTTPGFKSNLYGLLSKNNMLAFENEKLLGALTGDYADELDELMETDTVERRFTGFRDALIMRGSIGDIELLLRHFDVYDTPLEKRSEIYSRLCGIVSDFSEEQTEKTQDIVHKYEYKQGSVCKLLGSLVELKRLDIASAAECYDYFIRKEEWITKEFGNRENYDAWNVKFYIFRVCLPSVDGDYRRFKNNFRAIYNGFLGRNDENALNSVKEFAEYAITQRNNNNDKFDDENEVLFTLVRYAEFGKKAWSIQWGNLIEDIYKDKFNGEKLQGFAKSLRETLGYFYGERVINYDTYLKIYKDLCGQFFMIENFSSAEEFLNYCAAMFSGSGLNIRNASEDDPETVKFTRFLMLSLWGRASRILMRTAAEKAKEDLRGNYCPDCYCMIPVKAKSCPLCKRKSPPEAENALAELITVDFATLKNIIGDGEKHDRKSNLNLLNPFMRDKSGGGDGTFDFKTGEPYDTAEGVEKIDTVEVTVNGLSDKAAKFFGSDKNKNFMDRRKRTCLVVECNPGEETSDIFYYLERNYFPYLVLVKKQGEGLPALDKFVKNEEGRNTFQDEYRSKKVSMNAQVSYYGGSRPDELIGDLAQGIARTSAIKSNYTYSY